MKCPSCGEPELTATTKDEILNYRGQSLRLHSMHGQFCAGCGEGVWDSVSYRRYTEAQAALLRAVQCGVSALTDTFEGLSS